MGHGDDRKEFPDKQDHASQLLKIGQTLVRSLTGSVRLADLGASYFVSFVRFFFFLSFPSPVEPSDIGHLLGHFFASSFSFISMIFHIIYI